MKKRDSFSTYSDKESQHWDYEDAGNGKGQNLFCMMGRKNSMKGNSFILKAEKKCSMEMEYAACKF